MADSLQQRHAKEVWAGLGQQHLNYKSTKIRVSIAATEQAQARKGVHKRARARAVAPQHRLCTGLVRGGPVRVGDPPLGRTAGGHSLGQGSVQD
jgi:hypothetical protein